MMLTAKAAATGNPYAVAAAIGGDLAMQFIGKLKIRKGAAEADAIVPSQNELHYEFLAPGSSAADDPLTPLPELYAWRVAVNDAMQSFLEFIRDPKWAADGDTRASDQAYQTMFGNPGYARQVLEHLDRRIADAGGIPAGAAGAGSGAGGLLSAGLGGNGLLLVVAAVAIFLTFRR